MDHLLEAYASSSSDENDREEKTAGHSALGELPPDLKSLFKDSEYDLATERRRAEERAGNTRWVRRFPHERGNWPTHVFIPVPNSVPFKSMAEASVAHFRQRLADAWRKRHGRQGGKGGKKRGRDGRQCSNKNRETSTRETAPPEVVMNDMDPAGQQHLSLSKTTVLRAHQIEPFVQGLKEAVRSSRSFVASVVSGYDVLVNEDKTRSFVCLRVRGGRQMILNLIAKVDPLMRRFKQPEYYEDPVVHVSVASVLGDISGYVSYSSEGTSRPSATRAARDAQRSVGGGDGRQNAADGSCDDRSDEEDDEQDLSCDRYFRRPDRGRDKSYIMASEYQESSSADFKHFHTPGASIESLKARIKGYEERIVLLKEIKRDGDARLAAQEADIKRRNREIEEMKENWRKELERNDKNLSDAALSVRTREKIIINLNDQHCKSTMAIQRLHLSKHQAVADAKREVREQMRAEREQRKATKDIQNKSAGRSYNNRNIATSKDMGRRTPSSGSFFSRASTGGGSMNGAANGGSTGKYQQPNSCAAGCGEMGGGVGYSDRGGGLTADDCHVSSIQGHQGPLCSIAGKAPAGHVDSRTDNTSPLQTHQEVFDHLEDDGEHFPHEHVLEAIHSRVYEAHPFYKEEPEHGPYELQADMHVKLDTFSLDEHHADVAEVGLNHVDFLSGAVNDHLIKGSIMLGSHEGQWVDRLSAAGEDGQHLRRAETGIILARRITDVENREDGSTQVTTEAVHPLQAFHEVHFKLDWTPTPKMKKEPQKYEDGSERRLGGLSDCGSNGNFQSLEPFGIDVYDKCIDVGYDFDLFNFNKAPDCQLLLVVEEGTVDGTSWSNLDRNADMFVKASIDGTFRYTHTVWDDMTPEWSRTLDMGCPSDENEPLVLTMIEDDMLHYPHDEKFTCEISDWSSADPGTMRSCQQSGGDGEINYQIIFTPSFNNRAIVPLYDLDDLFAEHAAEAGLPFDATIDGFGCEECYGRVGSKLTLQLGYSGDSVTTAYIKYFKVSAEGDVDVHVHLLAEDPSFALFFEATLLEDLSYTPFINFGPYFNMAFKKKLDFELDISGSASGTAGVEFSVLADAEVGLEYTKASINTAGQWDAFADANWGYSVNVYNNLYDATIEVTAKLRATAYLWVNFMLGIDMYATVERSPYQGVKFYEDSVPQFSLSMARAPGTGFVGSSGDVYFEAGGDISFEIIYEHATVGENMIAYVELVNDCDVLGVFRIGEVPVEVQVPSASLDFGWVVPWDSNLAKAGNCSESWRGKVHFSGQTLITAQTDAFGLNMYSGDDGLFTAPGSGEVVPVDTEYDLTWDPTLLKYFVNGEGAVLGSEEVSKQVQLYVVNSNNSVYNMTSGTTNNTGSFSVTFPSTFDTTMGWYMLIFSAEDSAVWSWSPGWFTLQSEGVRKLLLDDGALDQETGALQDQPNDSPVPASKWPSFLLNFAEHGPAPPKEEGENVSRSMSENRRKLQSSSCMAFFNGQDAQHSLDKVSLLGFTVYENDAPDESIITPLTAGDESCTLVTWWLRDSWCDSVLNNADCGYDGGDCCTVSCASLTWDNCPTDDDQCVDPAYAPTPAPTMPAPWPDCDLAGLPATWLNDSYCDLDLNIGECGYDGGDCCTATCVSASFWDACTTSDNHCVDPVHAPTPAPTMPAPWPDCAFGVHPPTWLNDSYCDSGLNNEDCGYDGGDCCTATCASSAYYNSCPTNNNQCVDPVYAPTPPPSPPPTPAPTLPVEWQDCNFDGLPTTWLNDSLCDSALNNADCGYDGGDCCSATCVTEYSYQCSATDDSCVDPDHAKWPDCDFGDIGYYVSSDVNNSVCNPPLNTAGCGYDGGDCCTSTCVDSAVQVCSRSDYYCVDPRHLATPAPTAPDLTTPAPTIEAEWPDCVLGGSASSALGNSHCDATLNNEQCGYDGGDCCLATCVQRGFGDCADGNTFCVDERYRYDCDFGINGLDETNIGNGYCDEDLYTVPCDFDGGDCCKETCVSGPLHECPESKDDYPHCDEEQQQGEESEEEDEDEDDFSKAFAQGPASVMRLATLLSVGLGVARNLWALS
eukprot:g2925.t3